MISFCLFTLLVLHLLLLIQCYYFYFLLIDIFNTWRILSFTILLASLILLFFHYVFFRNDFAWFQCMVKSDNRTGHDINVRYYETIFQYNGLICLLKKVRPYYTETRYRASNSNAQAKQISCGSRGLFPNWTDVSEVRHTILTFSRVRTACGLPGDIFSNPEPNLRYFLSFGNFSLCADTQMSTK